MNIADIEIFIRDADNEITKRIQLIPLVVKDAHTLEFWLNDELVHEFSGDE